MTLTFLSFLPSVQLLRTSFQNTSTRKPWIVAINSKRPFLSVKNVHLINSPHYMHRSLQCFSGIYSVNSSEGRPFEKPLEFYNPRQGSIDQCMKVATEYLAYYNIPEPELSAEYLACAALEQNSLERLDLLIEEASFPSESNLVDLKNVPPSMVSQNRVPLKEGILNQRKNMKSRREFKYFLFKPFPKEIQWQWFIKAVDMGRKQKRIPIQYLVGVWEFYNLDLIVEPPILIPRPETEELVDRIINYFSLVFKHQNSSSETGMKMTRFLDIGCGTGAIGLSLLKAIPSLHGVLIDMNPLAVEVTLHNARRVGVQHRCSVLTYDFINGDIRTLLQSSDLSTSSASEQLTGCPFLFIVSNPPYIFEEDMKTLEPEVGWHEDWGALCGGVDGMSVIRAIIEKGSFLLESEGTVWMETDPRHPKLIERLPLETYGMKMVEKFTDFAGKTRFCLLKRVDDDTISKYDSTCE